MVKVAFAAELPRAASPSQVLCGINRTLCGKLQGQYVTAAYLYVDLAAQKIRYGAAAHPALFWSKADGETEHLLENGLMLGLFPNAEYTEQEREITRGDRFLLYTGGLVEAADPSGEFFGQARAETILRQERRRPAQSLLLTLVNSVSKWSSSAQDDLTLVAVGWRTDVG
jgi:sigma-B regulation protein RsbU (phosphoserine phosphatase)